MSFEPEIDEDLFEDNCDCEDECLCDDFDEDALDEEEIEEIEDLDEDWTCPHCGSEMDMFEKKEVENL